MTHTCLECTHCINPTTRLVPRCAHPDNGEDLVRGGTRLVTCRFARSQLSGLCGPEGRQFEPKQEELPIQMEDRYPGNWLQRAAAWVRGVWPW